MLLHDDFAKPLDRFHHLIAAHVLAAHAYLQTLQDVAQLAQQLLRQLARTGSRQILDLAKQLIEVTRIQHPILQIVELRIRHAALPRVFGQRPHETVERGTQIRHQPFDLVVRSPFLDRFEQPVLCGL